MNVEKHCAVDYAFNFPFKRFQIGIMCGNNAKSLLLAEFFQYGFGNGPSYSEFNPFAHFINQE